MSKIFIENYRGFDIEFDTSNEKFTCIATEEKTKESNSFTAVRKFVDDYKKTNQDFKPFWIESIPGKFNSDNQGKYKVIGVRKDGRFVIENEKAEKDQLSDFYLSDYMLVKPENQDGMDKYRELEKESERQRAENSEKRKVVIATLNIVTLKEYKRTLQ
jgi:hypothetical protein